MMTTSECRRAANGGGRVARSGRHMRAVLGIGSVCGTSELGMS